MGTKSPGTPQRCRLILNQCLAIQLSRPGNTPEDFWMYDSGYMIFQNFLAANAQCWWNGALAAATRALKYIGHVSPGILLVTAEPCALEVLRGAYARSVLKPPPTYVISSVGDIDDCILTPIVKGQFTPLPEALCDVIMDLTSQGQSATIENVKIKLTLRFPHMQPPSVEMIYDTLVQLMQERKIYQTAKGYFIVTPERRRSRSRPRDHRSLDETYEDEPQEARTILLTNSEALHNLYGEISTERDGDLTHQCIQTNLADVICGGNPNDKIMYARSSKRRSASFPTPRSLERRHSMRLFGSSKRLQRCSSTSLTKTYASTADSSSSENQSTDSSSPKKGSLLSRLFRRSGRSKQRHIETFSAQFPPLEWFNSRAVHLHSVGTQTTDHDVPMTHTLSNSTFYDGSELSQRSSTLPRRHHRRHMSSESTFLIWSRDCSPIRRRSPAYCSGSLPRSTHSIPSSVKPTVKALASKSLLDEQNQRAKAKQRLDSDPRHFRHLHSGPSSIESGKTSLLSGPSSIDSGKMTLSRTSGHSSLDSQASTSSRPPAKIAISPRSSPSHQKMKPHLRQTTSTGSSTKGEEVPVSRVANSTSNNSITLQVTTSGSVATTPSTKIFLQNSPVRSVITLENGKLCDNPNVFIINNETVKNANGELIQRHLTKIPPPPLETQFDDSETGDSLSLISENSPNSSVTPLINEILSNESTKFTKNVNNDAKMNNSRKMGNQFTQIGGNVVYKNVLKNNESDPTSPVNNKNAFRFSDDVTGSMGNLRIMDKLNSHCDLKNLQMDRKALTSSPAINTDSLAHILQKNIVAVGSEPNLVAKNTECKKILDKSNIDKEPLDRRLSLSKETPVPEKDSGDLYNFPSLTDLSFNFTSLAAQKILQGVSINSIDTLVELNMANGQDKSKPSHIPSLCTDYGMI
ncbi:uncharacterized protein LOC129793055 isoform X2 [Lutzomyia longipalpis]|uniref:uncharacterized protein LOC129793055 isoform X2 n=1 Tax=Lutzomyia longipalpis TaxID=7200 RepID=UPI002483CC20|nr:uncharacterized protein LOC129793055 isoform X2 [Lutzomyia longipalpis]